MTAFLQNEDCNREEDDNTAGSEKHQGGMVKTTLFEKFQCQQAFCEFGLGTVYDLC